MATLLSSFHQPCFLCPTHLPYQRAKPSPSSFPPSTPAFRPPLFLRLSRFARVPVSATFKDNWGDFTTTLSDFTSLNHWTVRDYYWLVDSVNSLEDKMQLLTDELLVAKTEELRRRLKEGETLAEI